MMEQTETKTVITQFENHVFTITMNRPHVLNALTNEMFKELQQAIHHAATDDQIKIVILQGAGGNFCSGADLSVLGSMSTREQADESLDVINSFLRELHYMNKPVIAVIEGVAVGAGLNLALHADFVLATKEAVLQEPFVHIGLTTDFGGTYLLPRLVGMAQAKRLAMLGEKISGQEAAQIGLIFKAVEVHELSEQLDQLIATLFRLPPQAVVKTKEGLETSLSLSLDEALEWEKANQPELILNPSFQALVAARLKK